MILDILHCIYNFAPIQEAKAWGIQYIFPIGGGQLIYEPATLGGDPSRCILKEGAHKFNLQTFEKYCTPEEMALLTIELLQYVLDENLSPIEQFLLESLEEKKRIRERLPSFCIEKLF